MPDLYTVILAAICFGSALGLALLAERMRRDA